MVWGRKWQPTPVFLPGESRGQRSLVKQLSSICSSSSNIRHGECRDDCCCSVAKLYLILWDPMDCNTLGFPVFHYLPEFAQIHVHWVSDVIQPSHPLSPPSPPALSLSQHQGLFQCIRSSHQVAKDMISVPNQLTLSSWKRGLSWVSLTWPNQGAFWQRSPETKDWKSQNWSCRHLSVDLEEANILAV